MPLHILMQRNGRVYGHFGPYKNRSAALLDAALLKNEGSTLTVEPCRRCSLSGRAKPKVPRAPRARTNAASNYRGVRIQRTAGVVRFTHPVDLHRVSVGQGAGGIEEAKRQIDDALDSLTPPMRRNSAAMAAVMRWALPFLLNAAASVGKRALADFVRLPKSKQRAQVRKWGRLSPALALVLRSDRAADVLAVAIVDAVKTGAADTAMQAAGARTKAWAASRKR